MQPFYPGLKPYTHYELPVQKPHVLYVEECGNPQGIPVVVIHEGPGAGCTTKHRRFFDPGVYRIILFDQRGCGRSKPHTDLTHNTTQDLIADLETLREHVGVKKWLLFGGGWGSTLSLAYAQQHPKHVSGMILFSIFLARPQDFEWTYNGGLATIFPDYWQEFTRNFDDTEQENLVAAYNTRLNGPNELACMAAAKNWALFEARCATLQPHQTLLDRCADPIYACGFAHIAAHYFNNHCFLDDDQLLKNCQTIRQIPTIIIHGRYDMITPLDNAWTLQQRLPQAELYIIRDAGHAWSEPGIIDALIHASKKMGQGPYRPSAG